MKKLESSKNVREKIVEKVKASNKIPCSDDDITAK